MSTVPAWMNGMRWALVTEWNSIWLSFKGLMAPKSLVSGDTPTMSRPRFWISAMNVPAGISPGGGRGVGVSEMVDALLGSAARAQAGLLVAVMVGGGVVASVGC